MLLIGIFFGALGSYFAFRLKWGSFEQLGQGVLAAAELEARHQKELALLEIQHLKGELKREEKELEKREKERSEEIAKKGQQLEKKLAEVEKKEAGLLKKERDIDAKTVELTNAAELSREEAKAFLLAKVEREVERELLEAKDRKIKESEENGDREAARIITTAINRLAASAVSEHTVNTVSIPSDEVKARIIGREGRNIRCLERETGVNFLIDDTPGAIVLSCFDPIRLHTAKMALQELILDGRIHPTRIEEAVDKAGKKIRKEIQVRAEEAALQAGVFNLHPELLTLLGQLGYRYSLGQNVLTHSIEVSCLMGMMAAELGLDAALAKRIGLLHDIGKAANQEMEGSHAQIGFQLTQKYGESLKVSNGVGCHHGEIEPITCEASLCSAADALSASRPGARLEAVESYLKRLQNLEQIAAGYPGVEKVYALQAGREVRVTVLPDLLDDAGTKKLAKEITKRIEDELKYYGKIKVTVIREQRVTEYAI